MIRAPSASHAPAARAPMRPWHIENNRSASARRRVGPRGSEIDGRSRARADDPRRARGAARRSIDGGRASIPLPDTVRQPHYASTCRRNSPRLRISPGRSTSIDLRHGKAARAGSHARAAAREKHAAQRSPARAVRRRLRGDIEPRTRKLQPSRNRSAPPLPSADAPRALRDRPARPHEQRLLVVCPAVTASATSASCRGRARERANAPARAPRCRPSRSETARHRHPPRAFRRSAKKTVHRRGRRLDDPARAHGQFSRTHDRARRANPRSRSRRPRLGRSLADASSDTRSINVSARHRDERLQRRCRRRPFAAAGGDHAGAQGRLRWSSTSRGRSAPERAVRSGRSASRRRRRSTRRAVGARALAIRARRFSCRPPWPGERRAQTNRRPS